MQYEDALQQNDIFFAETLTLHDKGFAAVGWNRKASQEARFKALRDCVGSIEHASIVDMGCGTGDMYNWLHCPKKYIGLDRNLLMIDKAKSRFPDGDFRMMDMGDELPRANIYFCSGLFNKFYDKDTLLWGVKRMFDACNYCLAFNALSSWATENFNPEEIFSECKKISPKILLRHDYLVNDFTIALYRSKP